MTKHNFKLSTKLVATITSLCACLAVLAVGVYATLTNFTISIVNQVTISHHVANLTIYVYAKNAGDGYYDAGYQNGSITAGSDYFYAGEVESFISTDGKYPVKLFEYADIVTDEGEELSNKTYFENWQEHAQFTNKTMGKYVEETEISYVFTIMPSLLIDTVDYAFSIYEKSLPTATTPTTVFTSTYQYRVSIDGVTWSEWSTIPLGYVNPDNQEVTVGVRTSDVPDATAGAYALNFANTAGTSAEQKVIQVKATCSYNNSELKRLIIDDDWEVDIAFYTAKTIVDSDNVTTQDGSSLSTSTNDILTAFPLYVEDGENFVLNPVLVDIRP